MSQYNIGPKIGIEGEREFRAQLSRINSEYRSMDSYLKALDQSMAQNGRSQEALAAKGNVLRQQIGLEEQRYKELSTALERAAAAYGENSQEALRFRGALLDVENTVATLARELGDTEDEMQRLANGIDDVGDSADSTEAQVMSFGDMLKAGIASDAILNTVERVGEFIVDIGQKAIEAAADVKAADSQFSQTFGDLEATASSALTTISRDINVAVTRLRGGYTSLYAFTKNVGGDQETALNIAQRGLRAAADSAAYYDRSMEDATETLQSFLKGNYENDAALGIAATETTRNAKANELYAKSFKELSESQKVDVLLAMVEAGNAASGALGQAAREADSWTNVTGELAEAWRQFLAALGDPVMERLIPVIQGITGALQGMTGQSSFDKLSQGIDTFRTGLEAADAALADSTTKMAATSGLAQQYVDRLRELEGAGLDTADAQREYAQVVELLNTLMPELDLTINEATGRLKQNTVAIDDNIQSLREQAEQQAKMAYYKTIIDAYAEAYETQYAAEQRLLELKEQERQLLEQGADAAITYTGAMTNGVVAANAMFYGLSELDQQLLQNQAEQGRLTLEIEESSKTLEKHRDKLDEATDGYESFADGSDEATDASKRLIEAQKALDDAYAAAEKEARESIDSQIGLFDELASKNEWSAEKIIQNWENQQAAFANYEDNLKKATELGLDETLVAQLSDGSQQSMMILDALVNDTEISVDEINAAFRDRMAAKESVVDEMKATRVAAGKEYRKLQEDVENAGKYVMEGGARGIRNYAWKLEQAMGEAANLANKAYRMGWEINSPSRKMMENSDYIIDGGVLQIQRRTRDMERAMSDLAEAGTSAYLQETLDHVAQYPSMMQGVPGYGTSTTQNTRNVAYGGISININTQPGQDAQAIADAAMEELTVRLGQEEASW